MNKEEALEIIEAQIEPFGDDETGKDMEEAWNYIKENLDNAKCSTCEESTVITCEICEATICRYHIYYNENDEQICKKCLENLK